MNDHTRGPWTVADNGTIEAAFCGRIGYLSDVGRADARLIAAAPDLLAALQALVKLHHDWDKGRAFISVAFYEENQTAIAQARAAIARALGKA